MGLAGEDPVTCDPSAIHPKVASIRATGRLALGGDPSAVVAFDSDRDLRFHRDRALPFHPNGLRFEATLGDGSTFAETYYSIGGGFVVREGEAPGGLHPAALPMPIETPADLVRHCREHGLTIPEVVLANERTWRDDRGDPRGLLGIWDVMKRCIHRGGADRGHPPRRPGRGPAGGGDEPQAAGGTGDLATSTPGSTRSGPGAASSARSSAG